MIEFSSVIARSGSFLDYCNLAFPKMMYNRLFIEGKNMNQVDPLLEDKVIRQLLEDIGLGNTRKFIDSLDSEIYKRIQNITQAINERNFEDLAAQAHSLKSSAQVSCAYRLADSMVRIEKAAGLKKMKYLKWPGKL